MDWHHDGNRAERLQRSGLPANNHELIDSTRLETEGKTARFVQMLRELPAGLTEWAVHPALDTVEARAIDAWWSKRVADLEFLTSQEARDTISSEGIDLLDYRPLQSVWC
jgi:chitin disaccharide deacetylase